MGRFGTKVAVVCILFALLSLGGKCRRSEGPAAGGRQGRPIAELLDLSDPGSWEAAVTDQHARASKIAESLISVARDKQRSDDDRRKAILLLGRIGNSECVEFLVANVGILLPMRLVKGDADHLLQRPCTYALSRIAGVDRNWNVVPVILRELAKPTRRTRQELRDFAFVLESICGKKTARFLVEQELGRASDATVKENLKGVLRYM
jgi:hypothetical protein